MDMTNRTQTARITLLIDSQLGKGYQLDHQGWQESEIETSMEKKEKTDAVVY